MAKLFGFLSKKPSLKEHEPAPTSIPAQNPDIEELEPNELLLLTRQLMTLARRRRCATNHLGEDALNERGIDWKLESWYYENGYTDAQEAYTKMRTDLEVILNNPTQASETIKKRVLLTNYFSGGGMLEDNYSFGEINPFFFESEGVMIGLRDTFFDRMKFPTRMATIVSFDPEIQEHRHQIRYWRALLVSYSLAHILREVNGESGDAISLVLQDELAMANGWLMVAEKLEKLSIKPEDFSPDESLLYDSGKVWESTMLFDEYSRLSEKLLLKGSNF